MDRVQLGQIDHTDANVLEDVVNRAAEGNKDAQRQLFEHYWPFIERVINGRLKNLNQRVLSRAELSDLAQDAALRLLESLHKQGFRGREAFRGWMKRVTDSAVLDRYRYKKAQRRTPEAEEPFEAAHEPPRRTQSPESRIDAAQSAQRVRQIVLEHLKEEDAGAIFLHHAGCSYEEIGDILAVGPEAVRKRIARGQAKLARLLSEDK